MRSPLFCLFLPRAAISAYARVAESRGRFTNRVSLQAEHATE